MSIHTYSIPVKFAAYLDIVEPMPLFGKGESVAEAIDSVLKAHGLTIAEVGCSIRQYPKRGIFGFGVRQAEVEVRTQPIINDLTVGTTVRGWAHVDDCAEVKQGRHSVHVAEYTKDGDVVYVINESQYACVGSLELTAFADNQEALQRFLTVFSPSSAIIPDTAVSQTI